MHPFITIYKPTCTRGITDGVRNRCGEYDAFAVDTHAVSDVEVVDVHVALHRGKVSIVHTLDIGNDVRF